MSEKTKKIRKKMSKKKKAVIIISVILIVFIAYSAIMGQTNGAIMNQVVVAEVKREEISSNISVTGKIESLQSKTYFSPVNAKITEFLPKVGEVVKAGTVLVAFDTSQLEKDNLRAELNRDSIVNGNQATLEQTNQSNAALNKAQERVNVLSGEIAGLENQISEITKSIEEKATSLQTEQSVQYEMEIARLAGLIGQIEEAIALLDPVGDVTEINELEINKARYQEELSAIQQAIASVSNAELAGLQTKLGELQMALQEKQAEYQAQKGTVDNAIPATVSNATRAQMTNNSNLAALELATIESLIAQGREGIKAEFDGIVARVGTVEGSSVAQGMELFTIVSNREVVVNITVSKYDYDKLEIGQTASIEMAQKEYAGTVYSISKIAETNESGASVIHAQVKITNPDDDIFLGIEAKVTIQTGSEANALVVERRAINTDKNGDFVYIVENGKVESRQVEIGLSSFEFIEIKKGLSEGDQVITELPDGMELGSPVVIASDKE